MKTYIVTRHIGAIRWLEEKKGIRGEVVAHLTPEEIEQGVTYVGTLPLQMIGQILKAGSRFFLLDLPAVAWSQRGQELTPEEMEAAGARLLEVLRVDLKEV